MNAKNLLIGLLVVLAGVFVYYYFFGEMLAKKEVASVKEQITPRVQVHGTLEHPASGYAHLAKLGDTYFVVYKDFKTLEGVNLYVLLSKDLTIRENEYVELGPLKAFEGDFEYEIPNGIDVQIYPYALVYSKAFGIVFNSAKLY
jgi:hypothetical protein